MANLLLPCRALAVPVLLCAAACSPRDDGDVRADYIAGRSISCPVITRSGQCRPAGPDEVVTITTGGLLIPAAGFAKEGGFSAFSLRWSDARIISANAMDTWQFRDADALDYERVVGASGTTVRGAQMLYFVAGSIPRLQVTTVDHGRLNAPSPVTLEGADVLPSSPQAVGLADGRVLLTFVDPQRRVFVGVDDGTATRFRVAELALPHDDLRGVLANVAETKKGTWVLAYQVADEHWKFRSYAIVSRDGGTSWSQRSPMRVSQDDDVSGAFPFARADGGADLYYVTRTPVDDSLFDSPTLLRTVRRRALHEDGTLGDEQVVTSVGIGDVAYPRATRLPDGRIALMLTSSERLVLVVLDGDAPR